MSKEEKWLLGGTGSLPVDLRRALAANLLVLAGLALFVLLYAFQERVIASSVLGMDVEAARLYIPRIILLVLLGQILFTGAYLHRRTTQALATFFLTPEYPTSLAVMRIVVFLLLLIGYGFQAEWYASLPVELRYPPFGIGRMVDLGLDELVYYTPQQVKIAYILFLVFCVTGLLGLFSRTSAAIVVVLGMFPLAAPELYGKVNHAFLHVLWFAALLAASPSGDALSLDAVRRARKSADKGIMEEPRPSVAYSLPLRFAWILIGLIYFFPGFWKTWLGGYEWVAGDAVKYIMHGKWFDLSPWTPLFRVDKNPLVYRAGGLATLLFELGFIFLVFFRRTRLLAALGGLAFHLQTYAFMGISFYPLMACYVVFFDWRRIFRWTGSRLFPEQMYVLYDGSCKPCRRTIATLQVFDVFGRIQYVNGMDEEAMVSYELPEYTPQDLAANMYAVRGKQEWIGFDAYRALAKRIPILWPVYPLLFVGAVAQIGRRQYRRFADARTCSLESVPFQPVWQPGSLRSSVLPVLLAAAVIVSGNLFCGFKKQVQAWPFACHPTFTGKHIASTKTVMLKLEDRNGERTDMSLHQLMSGQLGMHTARADALLARILNEKDASLMNQRLNALWSVVVREGEGMEQIERVRFYEVVFSTDPDAGGYAARPLKRQLIHDFSPSASALHEVVRTKVQQDG